MFKEKTNILFRFRFQLNLDFEYIQNSVKKTNTTK